KKIVLPLILSGILISACGNGEDDPSEESEAAGSENIAVTEEDSESNNNLFDASDIEEGYWIGQSGNTIQNEDMVISNPIDYDPSLSYTINRTAYITYMSDGEILQTVLYDDAPPVTIRTNEDADSIRVSFDKSKLDSFNMVSE